MKVVLFCGGQGLRFRDEYPHIPKPMVEIGSMPILWHVMKYYAHFGHKEFILCLGHQGEIIRDAFEYRREVLSEMGKDQARLLPPGIVETDISDWNITFVDTGIEACVGERLVAVRELLEGEETFLANYADGVTDLNLPTMIEAFSAGDSVASCVSVKPNYYFHVLRSEDDSMITDVVPVAESGIRINGGYFIFRSSIFDYIRDGEDLVNEPFQRLASEGNLIAYRHDGFWACMDTFKEKMALEEICAAGDAPWEIWKTSTDNASVRQKDSVAI